jgi:putative ABC transport system permease protein
MVTIMIAALGTASMLIAGGFALYTYDSLREGASREYGHITVAHSDFFNKDEDTPMQYGLAGYDKLATHLEDDPRVRRVLPRIALSGLVSNGEKSMVFMGIGADILAEAAMRGPFLKVLAGALTDGDRSDGPPRVFLGSDLAKSLNAKPGSGVTLLTTTTDGGINAVDVEVAGIISTGWREVDKRLVYTGIRTAQKMLVTDKVSTLAVFLQETDMTADARRDFLRADDKHTYKPWWEQSAYYVSVRDLYDRIFGLLGVIIAALVFFSVANTLTMSVVERTREIGTLRALGAQPQEIVADFVREGLLIGLTGSTLGMLLAGLVSVLLLVLHVQMPPPPGSSEGYPLNVYADPTLYSIAFVVIVVLCGFAAWLASRKAAKKPIVEALGHV